MVNIKETIVNECLNVLHREDVKKEFKELMRPLIDMLIKEIYPYIFHWNWLFKMFYELNSNTTNLLNQKTVLFLIRKRI